MRNRIHQILKDRVLPALLVLVLFAGMAAGCSFTQPPAETTAGTTAPTTVPTQPPQETTAPSDLSASGEDDYLTIEVLRRILVEKGTDFQWSDFSPSHVQWIVWACSSQPAGNHNLRKGFTLKMSLTRLNPDQPPQRVAYSEFYTGETVQVDPLVRLAAIESNYKIDATLHHESDPGKSVSIRSPEALDYIDAHYPSSGAGKLVYVQGKLYRFYQPCYIPSDFTESGSIQTCDVTAVPTDEYASNYFFVGTKVYTHPEHPDVIYVKAPSLSSPVRDSIAGFQLIAAEESDRPYVTYDELLRLAQSGDLVTLFNTYTYVAHSTQWVSFHSISFFEPQSNERVTPDKNVFLSDFDTLYCYIDIADCDWYAYAVCSNNKDNNSRSFPVLKLCSTKSYTRYDLLNKDCVASLQGQSDIAFTTQKLTELVNRKVLFSDYFQSTLYPYETNLAPLKTIYRGYYISGDYQMNIYEPTSCEHIASKTTNTCYDALYYYPEPEIFEWPYFDMMGKYNHYHFELYHLDDPDTVIDLATDDLTAFLARELPAKRKLTVDRLKWILENNQGSLTTADLTSYEVHRTLNDGEGTTEYLVSDEYLLRVNDSGSVATVHYMDLPSTQTNLVKAPSYTFGNYEYYVHKSRRERKTVYRKGTAYYVSDYDVRIPSWITLENTVSVKEPFTFSEQSYYEGIKSNFFPVGSEVYTPNDSYMYVRDAESGKCYKLVVKYDIDDDPEKLLTMQELYEIAELRNSIAMENALKKYTCTLIEKNGVPLRLFDIASSQYMLEVSAADEIHITIKLFHVQTGESYALHSPTQLSRFLIDWADKVE